MRKASSLTTQRRTPMVALFENGHGRDAAATHLGVSRDAVGALNDRWRLHGRDAPKATKRVIPFEVKLEIGRRVLAGETKMALAQAYSLSSPKLIERWVRTYRAEGEDGWRTNPKGRPKELAAPGQDRSELEQLRHEHERLRAEVASLGNLRAVRIDEPS
jgi:transposase